MCTSCFQSRWKHLHYFHQKSTRKGIPLVESDWLQKRLFPGGVPLWSQRLTVVCPNQFMSRGGEHTAVREEFPGSSQGYCCVEND